MLREFSRRQVEIEERAVELTGVGAGELSRERSQGIALATRRATEYGVDGVRWREEARARAAEHGLGEREIARLRSAAALATRAEADVVRSAVARLSGPVGLTANHNTFARRHVLAELAADFGQGASVDQLERATTAYLGHRSVVSLRDDGMERRYTTCDLLACERAVIEGARRRATERVAVIALRADRCCGASPSGGAERRASDRGGCAGGER